MIVIYVCVCMLCIHVISLVTEIRKFSCTNRKNETIYVFELESNAQAHTNTGTTLTSLVPFMHKSIGLHLLWCQYVCACEQIFPVFAANVIIILLCLYKWNKKRQSSSCVCVCAVT